MESKLAALLASIIGAVVGVGRYSADVLYMQRKFKWLEILLSAFVGASLGLVTGALVLAATDGTGHLWAFALAGAVAAGGDKGFQLIYHLSSLRLKK